MEQRQWYEYVWRRGGGGGGARVAVFVFVFVLVVVVVVVGFVLIFDVSGVVVVVVVVGGGVEEEGKKGEGWRGGISWVETVAARTVPVEDMKRGMVDGLIGWLDMAYRERCGL